MGMEFVAILRLLWRQRLLVTAAGVLALLIGVSMAYRLGLTPQSRSYQVGVGSVTALVDTPSSQVVDLGGGTGSDVQNLSGRASLLASLMTSSPIKDEIAARAGVAADAFITVPLADGGAAAAGASGDSSGSISPNDRRASILKASIPQLESTLPIISVRTQAPDAEAAARLANDSIAVLQEHLKSVAGTDKVPTSRRVVVRQLGPARSVTVTRGPGKTMAIAVTIVVFLLACALIVGVSALARGWRSLAELERSSGDAGPEYADPAELEALPADDRSAGGRRWRLPRGARGDAPETSAATRGVRTGPSPRPAPQDEAQDPARPSRVDVVNF
jgi:hypothetical protein